MSPTLRWLGLIAWVLACLAAGWLGSTTTDTALYRELERPSWAPPAWLFGPVWTVLYVMMGVAAWLVWKDRGFRGAPAALGVFLVQLALNAAWTPIFFGLEALGGALVAIVVLAVAIVATIALFARLRPAAAALLVPYLGWVSYATALTGALWRLNDGGAP